ncbi:hypothetical protein ACGFIF_32470 [Kribbella sp. NPDC049174]|uniref:hypothetical protein n=1 Tax=Kribbella sp. NPDC049174 TaxID=3364112 RepID=UPI0037168AC7
MIVVEMPDPPMQDVVLEAKEEFVRSGDSDPAAAEPVRQRISVGGPIHRRIDADSTDDAELRHFLKEEAADSDFYLLHLTCTLRHTDDEPFTEALLELDLTAAGTETPPIAWSMQPDRMSDAVEVSRTVSLGPTMKILGVGIEAKGELARTVTRREAFLEAMYELESTPSWALYRTSSTELRGLYRFHLVVRTPKDARVTGTTTIEAKVRRKRFGVIPYRAVLTDVPATLSFQLDGSDT